MALITCPECEKQISEHALSCPNCGFPLTSEKVAEIKKIVEDEPESPETKEERLRYEREFYKSLEAPKSYKNEVIPHDSKPKETLRPIIKTLAFASILLLSLFLINYISTYKTSDVRRYENGSNDVGNSNTTEEKAEDKNLLDSIKNPKVDTNKAVHAINSQVYVKVIISGVEIKFSPSSSSKTIAQAINGNIFELSEEKGDWYGINMFSGEWRYLQKSNCVKIKYGQILPKDVQFKKMVFKSIVEAEDKAQAEADVRYPTDIEKNIDLMRILVDKYKLAVFNKYKLQPPVYQELKIEGAVENWLQ